VSVAVDQNGSGLVSSIAVPEDRDLVIAATQDSVGASRALVTDWKSHLKLLAYWVAWVAFAAWAIERNHYYLMNGWWMVLLAFWFTCPSATRANCFQGKRQILLLALVTIAAAFLIYGTFEWLQEMADGWSWGPLGSWQRVVSIPLRTLVAAGLTAVLLVPLLRRPLNPYSAMLLIIAALTVGIAEYGSGLGSAVHWREHWLASCIELFSVIILPLVLAAVDGRLATIQWPSGPITKGAARLWRGETPTWVALLIVYPVTITGVIWLNAHIHDLYKQGYSDWEYANRQSIGWVLLILLLIIGSLVTFRTLNRSVKKGSRLGRWLQGVIVLIPAPFMLITLFGDGFSIGHMLTESAQVALGSAYDFQVSSNGAELKLSGDVAYDLADRLKEELDIHPGVSRIRLESGGGDVHEAFRAAKIIAAHNLDTVVSGKCVSACTIMFVAGKDRTLDKGAGLGFHAARSEDPTEGAAGSFRAAFKPYGIDKAFVARVERTKPSEMWYPTRRELFAAHVLSAPPVPEADVTKTP
jgi:hypothetical protein